MLIVNLAFKNIINAGLRTWLNVFVLSLAFVSIIWLKGLMNGAFEQIRNDMVDTELGGGQIRHRLYDPLDPLNIDNAHAPLTPSQIHLASRGDAVPVLITPGAVFPKGRAQTVLIKGILPDQHIVNMPTEYLKTNTPDIIPALIGSRMADQTGLKIGDEVTIRWRDINGTFDAMDVRITHIMHTTVQSVDSGQVWLPLSQFQKMMQAPGNATYLVLAKHIDFIPPDEGAWVYRDQAYLLKDIDAMYKAKIGGISVLFALILSVALLAIFDTQVLAIFRRRKEMGTMMALGMSRKNIIGLFTLEGSLHGVLALAMGAVYGTPLFILTATKGLPLPEMVSNMGFAMSSTMYPSYGMRLWMGTSLLVLITVTVVSFLPTRKISKLKPTDALRGKLT